MIMIKTYDIDCIIFGYEFYALATFLLMNELYSDDETVLWKNLLYHLILCLN